MRRHLVLLLAASSACAVSTHVPFHDADYPGTLQPARAMREDVVWQQRVTAAWGVQRGNGGSRGFDAAIQKQGEVLTVLGMSPMGSVGFTLLLRECAIEVRNDSGEELPFPARFVLLDVQRTFYPWLGEPLGDGSREATVGDERIAETWRGGHIVERSFRRIDGVPAGRIVVAYGWTQDDEGRLAPHRTVLHNEWFDYTLTIDTHAETRLPVK